LLNLFLIPILYVIVRKFIPLPRAEAQQPEAAQ